MTIADEAGDLFDAALARQEAKPLNGRATPQQVGYFEAGFNAGAEWQASRDVAEVATLTAQLQAAQATIADAKGWADNSWGYTEKVQINEIRRYLSRADLSTLAEHDKRMKFEGWDEACQALAWCFDNGPERDALPYLIEHNPFADSIEQTEAE